MFRFDDIKAKMLTNGFKKPPLLEGAGGGFSYFVVRVHSVERPSHLIPTT